MIHRHFRIACLGAIAFFWGCNTSSENNSPSTISDKIMTTTVPATSGPAKRVTVAELEESLMGGRGAYPSAGMKLKRVELDEKGLPIAETETDDEITAPPGAALGSTLNTKGLEALHWPPVNVFLSPGNATDFFHGSAKNDEGTITWHWGFRQYYGPNPPARHFSGALIITEMHGKKRMWRITRIEATTAP